MGNTHIWQGTKNYGLQFFLGWCGLTAIPSILVYFGQDDRSRSSAWLVYLVIAVPFALMLGFSYAYSPRRLEADSNELILTRRALGAVSLRKDQIAGVRSHNAGRKNTTILIDVRARRNPLAITDVVASLGAPTRDVQRTLQALYGCSELERAILDTTMSERAIGLSQERTSWRGRGEPRFLLFLDVLCPPAAIMGMLYWARLWDAAVHASERELLFWFAGTLLVLGWSLILLFALATGGPIRELVIDNDGLLLRRRFRTTRIPVTAIRGVYQAIFIDPRNRPRSRILIVLRRWEYVLREESLQVDPPGLLAGVLLHRFGEWIPRSRRSR